MIYNIVLVICFLFISILYLKNKHARCHLLRHYGKVKDPTVENLLPEVDFEHTVGKRLVSTSGTRSVVLMVVDASDFDGSGHHAWGIKKPLCWILLQASIMPYFPLPLSLLAGTNLIMLLIFIFNPNLLPKKIHPPFDFRENSSSFDFREKSIKTPKENQKKICFYFVAPCVFCICSKVLFVFVPLDLNSTNPKSTIFEPRWKPQPLPSNCGSVCVCGGLDW